MFDVRMAVRDILSQRLWKLSDALEEQKYSWYRKEDRFAQSVLNALPTPSRIIRFSRDIVNHLAMAVTPPNCVGCDAYPCMCAIQKESRKHSEAVAKYREACKTWLTEDLADKLMNYEPSECSLGIDQHLFRENPCARTAYNYLATAYEGFSSRSDFDTFESVYHEVKDYL